MPPPVTQAVSLPGRPAVPYPTLPVHSPSPCRSRPELHRLLLVSPYCYYRPRNGRCQPCWSFRLVQGVPLSVSSHAAATCLTIQDSGILSNMPQPKRCPQCGQPRTRRPTLEKKPKVTLLL